ncbi:MAG: type II toxin-antitoxin system VapC family toxin [Gemmatimonadaceae bacterium]|nr:type II toxin-antitoxin system VapC family toxin [Acetobacteraceae bacterium]
MIVDSSALMAIIQNEPECEAMLRRLSLTKQRKISAATWVEIWMVVEGSDQHPALKRRCDDLLERLNLDIVAIDADLAWGARRAFLQYGRGRHPARLNFGDCFSYALAKRDNEPLLFKGDDFSQTDIQPALA